MTGSSFAVPKRWPWLYDWFEWYSLRLLRKHFHAVRLDRTSADFPNDDAPIIVALNHPGWWDPLLCVLVRKLLVPRIAYAPIDEAALKKYPLLEWFGFFPVEQGTPRGAVQFLRVAEAICAAPGSSLWLTVQGRFTDVRERPLGIRPGIGKLAQRLERAWIVPMAIEYVFWNERTPEALLRIGSALNTKKERSRSVAEWTAVIESAMTENQDALAAVGRSRDPSRCRVLLAGQTGIDGGYDWWRRLTAFVRGETFTPAHAEEHHRQAVGKSNDKV